MSWTPCGRALDPLIHCNIHALNKTVKTTEIIQKRRYSAIQTRGGASHKRVYVSITCSLHTVTSQDLCSHNCTLRKGVPGWNSGTRRPHDSRFSWFSSVSIKMPLGPRILPSTVQVNTYPTSYCRGYKSKVKNKSNPATGLDRPWGLQEVEAPRFQDNRHMKVVRLSALRTGHLYPQGNIPGTHFC